MSDYEIVPASQLHTHPENARVGNLDAIRVSIRSNGFYGVLIVDRATRFILAGNHRFMAGVAEGMDRFPVRWHDGDEDSARRILLVDNASADAARYDDEALLHALQSVRATDPSLSGTGFQPADLDQLTALLESVRTVESLPAGQSPEDALATYQSTAARQIVLVLSPDQYDAVLIALETEANGEPLAKAVLRMLQEEEERADPYPASSPA